MFGSFLGPNSHVGSMSVNITIGGNDSGGGIPFNNGSQPFGLSPNMQLPYNQNPALAVEYKETPVGVINFGELYIDSDYNLVIPDSFDSDKRIPKSIFRPKNDTYHVRKGDRKEYVDSSYESIDALICVGRADKVNNVWLHESPLIVTIEDIDNIEDRSKLDDVIYHTYLLAKLLWSPNNTKFTSFFLVLEECGTYMPGEPFMTTISGSALFSRKVYSINI